jgi:Flp pilus assembly protein TadD
MSLINDVLRKLDAEGQAPHQDAVPASLQTAKRKRRSGALFAMVGLVGAVAVGAGLVWGPWPASETPAPPPSRQSAQGGDGARPGGDPVPVEASGKEDPPGEGEAARIGPAGSGAAGETPPAEPLNPAPHGKPRASGPVEKQGREEESAPGRRAPPSVKKAPEEPLKVAVRPAAEESREAPRARPADPPASRSKGEGDGRVEVSVPSAWQSRQQARRLAREGFQALRGERYQEAGERLAEAHRLAPERPDIANNLGLARWRAGQHRQAVQTLIDGVEAHPGDPRLARNLGNLLRQQEGADLRQRGVRVLGKALQRQDRLGLYTILGALLRDMDRPEEAVSVYRRGASRRGSHWRLLVGLGGALEQSGRPREAVTVYRKARERLPAGQDGLAERLDSRIRSLQGGLD